MISLLNLVLDTITGLFVVALLLRFWIQLLRVRPPQQVAHFVFQLSDWIVKPLRRAIPGIGGVDWASLLSAYLVALACTALRVWLAYDAFPGLLPVLALLSLLHWMAYVLIALLILEVIFSWVNPHAPLAPFVQAMNGPLLRPIRRVVPLLGGLDLSPMILFVLLQVVIQLLDYLVVSISLL